MGTETAEEQLEEERWEDQDYEEGIRPGSEAKDWRDDEIGIYGPVAYIRKNLKNEVGEEGGYEIAVVAEKQFPFVRGRAAYRAIAAATAGTAVE